MNSNQGLAIITGGGSGIGKEIALRLAQDGYTIGVTGRNMDAVNSVVDEIKRKGGKAKGHFIDVTKKDTIIEAMNFFVDQYSDLKVWVSNAGVSTMNKFTKLTEEEWDMNLDVNSKGVFFCGQAATEQFLKQKKGGRIINIASMAGKKGNVPFLAHYVASKFAVVGLTQAMAYELGEHNITVNSVCPGYVSTPMQVRELEWESSLKNVTVENIKESMISDTPLGRIQTSEDVANVVSFLASDDAGFVTGEAISVNGGAFMD
ncbi:SDR family NAD(P)-dependent oxidoreductase [Virgibacillus sp. W0430]|uniref:SDR family NAD(P)-dependent oxidoreductase n=1 Tax=Virgibacillus sp. W0430 TaxID=3391580 RepID=UPI003F490370